MKRFTSIFNRILKANSNLTNKLLDRKYKKISKDYITISMDGEIAGLNKDLYNLNKSRYNLTHDEEYIDPDSSRYRERKLYKEIEELIEKHKLLFEQLDD